MHLRKEVLTFWDSTPSGHRLLHCVINRPNFLAVWKAGILMVRFSKKNLWKIFNIYMEVIFHKSFCPKVIGSGFENFTHTIKIWRKKSMTAGSEIISKIIFRIRDQKEFDLRKKIDVVRVRFYKFKAWLSPNLSFFWRNFVCELLSWVRLHD